LNPPSEDIKDILEQSSVGVGTFGTDLFISKEPDSPDSCITIYDTGSTGESQAGYSYDYPTIMIRIRGTRMGYAAAWALAEDVKDALHSLANETWNGTRYVGIWCMGEPNSLGYDDKQRPILTLNFRIHRTG